MESQSNTCDRLNFQIQNIAFKVSKVSIEFRFDETEINESMNITLFVLSGARLSSDAVTAH